MRCERRKCLRREEPPISRVKSNDVDKRHKRREKKIIPGPW